MPAMQTFSKLRLSPVGAVWRRTLIPRSGEFFKGMNNARASGSVCQIRQRLVLHTHGGRGTTAIRALTQVRHSAFARPEGSLLGRRLARRLMPRTGNQAGLIIQSPKRCGAPMKTGEREAMAGPWPNRTTAGIRQPFALLKVRLTVISAYRRSTAMWTPRRCRGSPSRRTPRRLQLEPLCLYQLA
jgi:hypothetical protein